MYISNITIMIRTIMIRTIMMKNEPKIQTTERERKRVLTLCLLSTETSECQIIFKEP